MKTYVLMIAEKFPKGHKRAGEPTDFPYKIKDYEKIHTIRKNYDLWAKRFEKINAGLAVLSVRVWEGKPYRSKQIEIFRYDYRRKIGIERLDFKPEYMIDVNALDTAEPKMVGYSSKIDLEQLAINDGLSPQDLVEWFKDHEFPQPLGIIHFTDFRYEKDIYQR